MTRISPAHAEQLLRAAASPQKPRRKPTRRPAGRGSEHAEQVALIDLTALHVGRHPELGLLFAVPNGARTSMSVARRLKAEGMRSGVPDLCLPVPRAGHTSLWIEMKYGRNTTSTEQEWWAEALTDHGARVVVCYSAEQALSELLSYLESPR